MREIRLYGSEGGGAARSPYPYLLRALKGHQKAAQSKRGAGAPGPPSPRAPPWVSVPAHFLLSPRIARFWAIRGERSGEGGGGLPIPESRVSLFSKSFSA